MNKDYEEYERKRRAEVLRGIEELVEKYKPRMEALFGMEIGDVKVREKSASQRHNDFIQYREQKGVPLTWLAKLKKKRWFKHKEKLEKGAVMGVWNDTIYVNPRWYTHLRHEDPPVMKNTSTIHELTHLLADNNGLIPRTIPISYVGCREFLNEGFAEYVAYDFREIYQDEGLKRAIENSKESRLKETEPNGPYVKGYKFFEAVGEKIGKENIFYVFTNPPQTMDEILEPEKYLARIEETKRQATTGHGAACFNYFDTWRLRLGR